MWRIALLFVAFVVPISAAAGITIAQQTSRIELTVRELDGIESTTRTVRVVAALRVFRDRVEVGGAPLETDRVAVERALGDLYDFNSGAGRSLELTKRLRRLEADWAAVSQDGHGTAIARTLATAIGLFDRTNDRSALTSDPDGATADLIDGYSAQMPVVSQRIDEAKSLLVRAIVAHRSLANVRIVAAVLAGQAIHAADIARMDLENAARSGSPTIDAQRRMRLVDQRLAAFVTFVGSTKRFAGRADPRLAVRDFGEATIEAVYAAESAFARTIGERLDARARIERAFLETLKLEVTLALISAMIVAVLLARTIRARDRREIAAALAEAERLSAELERNRIVEALSVTEAHFRAAFERSAIGVAILDRAGSVLRGNRALEEMFPDLDAAQIGSAHPLFPRLFAGDVEQFVVEFEAPQSRERTAWFEATLSLVRDDAGLPRFAIAMVKDITERKNVDDTLRHEASHDSLSGLPNRAFFHERLRATFFAGATPKGTHAVLFVDLDEFKFINDSLGHATGDLVIVTAGERLRAQTRPSDCVARFGGDEFAVLLGPLGDSHEVDAIVERIGRGLAEPIVLDSQEIVVTASIGVAILHAGYTSVEDVLRDADTAMYHAKANGRARAEAFDDSMHDHASRRLELATQLRRALDRRQFHLVYQPVVSLVTGDVRSAEALLRWNHPELGEISPTEFVPIAEENGLIVQVGRFVLEDACRQFASWKKKRTVGRPPRISVNASVREVVQTDYVNFVEDLVRRYGLAPGELVLEITESAVLSSGKFSSGTLERIKAAGVGLAIDDFGTGYSSLRYLQQFPFDELKIDRTFVSGTAGEIASEPIVTMVLSLAQMCGVSVVAEGVETAEQCARLRDLGCEFAQGFLFGEPMLPEALAEQRRPIPIVTR